MQQRKFSPGRCLEAAPRVLRIPHPRHPSQCRICGRPVTPSFPQPGVRSARGAWTNLSMAAKLLVDAAGALRNRFTRLSIDSTSRPSRTTVLTSKWQPFESVTPCQRVKSVTCDSGAEFPGLLTKTIGPRCRTQGKTVTGT